MTSSVEINEIISRRNWIMWILAVEILPEKKMRALIEELKDLSNQLYEMEKPWEGTQGLFQRGMKM